MSTLVEDGGNDPPYLEYRDEDFEGEVQPNEREDEAYFFGHFSVAHARKIRAVDAKTTGVAAEASCLLRNSFFVANASIEDTWNKVVEQVYDLAIRHIHDYVYHNSGKALQEHISEIKREVSWKFEIWRRRSCSNWEKNNLVDTINAATVHRLARQSMESTYAQTSN